MTNPSPTITVRIPPSSSRSAVRVNRTAPPLRPPAATAQAFREIRGCHRVAAGELFARGALHGSSIHRVRKCDVVSRSPKTPTTNPPTSCSRGSAAIPHPSQNAGVLGEAMPPNEVLPRHLLSRDSRAVQRLRSQCLGLSGAAAAGRLT